MKDIFNLVKRDKPKIKRAVKEKFSKTDFILNKNFNDADHPLNVNFSARSNV